MECKIVIHHRKYQNACCRDNKYISCWRSNKKLKSYKSCQDTKVCKCPLQNSYWKMAQGVRLYSTQLPFPKCCLCKGLTLQSFCYFWIKKLKVFLELLIYDRIWGVLKGQKPLGNVWSLHIIGIFRGVERGSLRINPFHGEGMDNLWNYTIWNFGHYFHCRDNTYQSITAPNIWIFFSMQE